MQTNLRIKLIRGNYNELTCRNKFEKTNGILILHHFVWPSSFSFEVQICLQVIPPGMDFSNVVVQEDGPEVDGELATLIGGSDGSSPKAIPAIWSEVRGLAKLYVHCREIVSKLLLTLPNTFGR